ncbi:MAG: AraC family transcriptional regulator [Sphingosinicella sp.]|nr:AraC family transcriptional regulator [Sphingosinicella sp.]
MSITDKALWVIERNSHRPLNLGDIAQSCGVSRSHLALAFGSALGLPVMKYLRMRRLSEAAHVLAEGAPDILTVALDAGYGSHEAFTRAFRDQFGMTPESVRDRGTLAGLPVTDPLKLNPKAAFRLDPPRFRREGTIRIVGLSEPCSFETVIKIPAQWQRFMTSYYEAIPDKLDQIPAGVSQVGDDDGQFQYLSGVEVARFGDIPEGLVKIELEPRNYALFEHRGHVATIYETYAAIWNEALPACGRTVADAPTIERHNPAFDPGTGEGGLTLWIPLAD